MFSKLALAFTTGVFALSLATPATATTYTVSDFTWDSSNSFDTAIGTYSDSFNSTSFPALNNGDEPDLTLGRLLGLGTPGVRRGVTLGDNTVADIILLSFSNPDVFLPNQDGDDFVVYERGNPDEPEAYAVAVFPTGGVDFSDFRYEIWDTQQAASGSSLVYLATGFDLSDFGLGAGDSLTLPRLKAWDSFGQEFRLRHCPKFDSAYGGQTPSTQST